MSAKRGYVVIQEGTNRTVVDKWRDVPFAQLIEEPVRNGIYKKKEYHGRGVKIVNMGELFANPRLRDVDMRRVELTESEQRRFGVQAGDLLFARRSLVAEGAGKCSVVLETNELTAFESSIIRARPDQTKADPLFLYYYFNSPIGLHALDTIRRQVAVAGITGTDLAQLPVGIPPLHEQRSIAQILGTLDDKIELNRRMNQTLEEMARALFKSWFVDFEPVRAKMEGRWRRGESLPGLPAEHYDLFPDRLVDSELGEVPEGWDVKTLDSYLETLETGYRPPGGVSGIVTGIPSMGAESIERVGVFDFSKTKYVPLEFYNGMNRGVVEDGDVLIYKDGGRPGELEPAVTYISQAFPFNVFCINEHVYRVRTKRFSQQLLYCYLTTSAAFWQMRELATGVAQPGLNRRAVESIAITVPADNRVLSACQKRIGPLLDECNINSLESRGLSQIRDTLLPKLVSGEVGVGGLNKL